MISEKQKEKARLFKRMREEEELFILPNAWDVGSARIFEKSGFEVLATSSAGVAHSLGLADGEKLELEDLLYLVKAINDRVDIPLSVDFERGFGDSPQEIKNSVRRVLEAGAVGINIEDSREDGSLIDIEAMAGNLKALAELKGELGLDFVINARTDSFLYSQAS